MLDPDNDDTMEVLVKTVNPTTGITSVTRTEFLFSDIRQRLNNDPSGAQEVIFDEIIDLTAAGALFVNALTVPAKSVIKYVGFNITELVVAGGTTVKIGIGLNAGDVDKYGLSAALTVNSKGNQSYATALTTAEAIDVNGVVTNGATLGDTNISAGKVRVVVIYDTPNVLADV